MLYTIKTELPVDYHCDCNYCKKFKGVILDPNGRYISCRKRRGYFSLGERAHIAKTPYPIAMWAVDNFTKEGDWVLDPTIGIGTTAVEAKKQSRNIIGIELNPLWAKLCAINCQKYPGQHSIHIGDVRYWKKLLFGINKPQLIINNPPYSADNQENRQYEYDERNLAFMKEDQEYYNLLGNIYNEMGECILLKDGYLVIGVKDMVHNKQAYLLHKYIADEINTEIYEFQGTWILPHYPRTLFMNTYPKRFPDVKIPLYQTILVFRRRT